VPVLVACRASALSGAVVGADEVLLYDASTTSNVKGKIASDAVSSAKIVDANVTTAKLADDCVWGPSANRIHRVEQVEDGTINQRPCVFVLER